MKNFFKAFFAISLLASNAFASGPSFNDTTYKPWAVQRSRGFELFDEQFGPSQAGLQLLSPATSGTAAQVNRGSNTSFGNAFYVTELVTGSTSTGRAGLEGGNTGTTFGTGFHYLEFRGGIRTSLSDGTDRYTVRLGFGDNITAHPPTDGAYFVYSDNINGGDWQCETRAAGTSTTADSNVLAAVNTYLKFAIQVNAAGTNVLFFINDVQVCSISTNIPKASNAFGLNFLNIKSLGTNARQFHLDYIYWKFIGTTSR